MAVTSRCPECQRQVRVPEDLLGKMVKCPTCGAKFTAAAGDEPPPGPPPTTFEAPGAPPEGPGPGTGQEERPWEERGRGVRRDYEPHRGTLLLVLGIISIVSGVLGFSTICCLFCVPMPLVGLGLGITSWVLGMGDLKKIDAGQMDLAGRGPTQNGKVCGIIGTSVSAAALLCGVGLNILGLVMNLGFGGAGGRFGH